MVQETLTQDAPPASTEVVPQAATEESAAPADTSAEPVEPSALEEESPFAVIGDARFKDAYELVESEHVKPHLERELRRTEERLRSQMEQTVAEQTRNWESTNLNRTLAGHLGTILEKIEEGDVASFERSLGKIEAIAEQYKPEVQKSLRGEGAMEAANVFYQNVLDLTPDRRSRDEIEDYAISQFRKEGQQAWGSVLKRLIDANASTAEEKGYKRGLKEGREAMEESAKAEARGQPGAGPDTTPARTGGGRRYSEMTFEERNKLTPAERDALIAQEMR